MKNRIANRKNILSVFALLVLTSLHLSGFGQGFHLGVKGGANMNKIDGTAFKDQFKLGYQLGAFAEVDFSQVIGIQPEVLFNQTNVKSTDQASDIFHPGDDIHLNYLSIPVLLRINAGKILTFHVGPQYSILINNHKTTLANAQDAFKSGDFSLAAGAQLNLGLLRIYGRYNIGLQDVGDVQDQDKWKSQQIQLGVGIAFF